MPRRVPQSRPSSAAPRPARPPTLRALYQALHDRWGDLHWWPGETRLEVMVGAVLTQNTAWGNVEKALANLKRAGLLVGPPEPPPRPARLHPGVPPPHPDDEPSARRLHALGPAGLAPLIRPSGYFNIKARRLWNLLDWFVTRHDARFASLDSLPTPALRVELLSVSGIGRETADSILLYALGREIFVIDAYTHRVFKRHGLAPAAAGYDELQKLATDHLPPQRALYNDFHAQLVMVGKDFCKPTARCQGCPLEKFLKNPNADGRTGPGA